MNLFDLHCDTLYRTFTENKSIITNDCEISVQRADIFDNWIECMAVWIPDEVRGKAAEKLVENCYNHLQKEIAESEGSVAQTDCIGDIKTKKNIILTIEGGAALNGKLENISKYRRMGVRAMTLTWNGRCEIGGGANVETSSGLTDFGRAVIPEMEKQGIVVDVSHASDKLFYDVAEIAKRPFVATHSNSRAVCAHRRNLTDEQFEIIIKSGGIVGLNFHKYFLSEDNQSVCDIIKHAEHFLSIGGEDALSIGSDFDGGELPDDMKSISDIEKVRDEFLRLNYNEELVNKIFYENAHNFFQNFDN